MDAHLLFRYMSLIGKKTYTLVDCPYSVDCRLITDLNRMHIYQCPRASSYFWEFLSAEEAVKKVILRYFNQKFHES